MSKEKKQSEMWSSVRRGAGLGLGFTAVAGGLSLFRQPNGLVKGIVKAGLCCAEKAAEAGEKFQDLYAEARSEYVAARVDATVRQSAASEQAATTSESGKSAVSDSDAALKAA